MPEVTPFTLARPDARMLSELSGFYRACREETDSLLLPDYFRSLPDWVFSEIWENVFAQPDHYRAALALIDGEWAGFYTVGPLACDDYVTYLADTGLPAHSGEIFQLYVLSKHQKRGLGKILYRHACRDLAALGHDCAVICTYPENLNAVGFYSAMGAAIMKTIMLSAPWNRDVVFLADQHVSRKS